MPVAEISLVFCRECSHLFNQTFETMPYSAEYDNSLHFSDTFQDYVESLADILVERYSLCGKTIVEIGCGRGDFLRMLCSRGAKLGVGFDPSCPAALSNEMDGADSNITIERTTFPGAHTQLTADFYCSRHTLEHIGNPRCFLSLLRKVIEIQNIPVVFEVPNSLYTLRDGGIWDVIYEHRSYFSHASLARLFWECDFEPVESHEAYGGQFLTIHAMTGKRSAAVPSPTTPHLNLLADTFAARYQDKRTHWQEQIRTLHSSYSRPVLWGAGSKATTFLNLLQPPSIDYVVDLNPRKQGKFMVGTGQLIVAPEFLKEYCPDVVIVTNDNYASEIRQSLWSLGLETPLLLA